MEVPEGGTWSEMSGAARDVVQARDVSGGIHFHRPIVAVSRPRQLPGAEPVFINREQVLADLNAGLSGEARLAVIVGMPGVGKTSLALHWAHQNQGQYPDGHLYLNLHGYDAGPQVGPLRALWGFLLALGVPRVERATGIDEAAAQYRSALAGRRVLVVLDNAREAGQVRPLLPGQGECAVVVTSRNHMSGLVAREGGRRITLSPLSEADSIELLTTLTQAERANDASTMLGELASLCARLPLALRIAAEHALSRPWTRIEDLVVELRDQTASRTALTMEERQGVGMVAAQSVFSWSYVALPTEAARVFRLLALHPGPDFSDAAAIALTGTQVPGQALGILVGAHLLEQLAADRYQFHDLVRSFAMGQASDEEAPERLENASRQVLLWYLRSADAAQPWINPDEARVPIPEQDDEQAPKSFGSYDEAARWFDQERGNLAAAVRVAAERGMDEIAWKLAVVLRAFYMRFNTFEDWFAVSEAGLQAAHTLGDLPAQAELLESLGMAYSQTYDLDHSENYQRQALEIRRRSDDKAGVALSLNDLGLLHVRRHHFAVAQAMFEETLGIYADLGDEHWVTIIQENLAEALIGLDRYREAEALILAALAIFRERDDIGNEGNALLLLSMARRGLGDTDRAREAALRAVGLAVAQHSPGREGYWLLELGKVQQHMSQLDDALTSFQRSALLHRSIGHKVREAQAWDGEGEVQRDLGHLTEAIELHNRAAGVFRALGARWLLAVALGNVATARAAAGQADQARENATEALGLLAEFPDPAAQRLREALAALA